MTAPPFTLFGPDHVAALGLVALATVAAVTACRRGDEATRRRVRRVLATGLLLGVVAEPIGATLEGWLDRQLLPLHLCDVAVFLATWSLLTLDRRTSEPLYFLALSGTLPALFTPELFSGFPSFRFLIYFVPHGLVLVSVAVLVGGLRQVPRPGAWLRAFALLNVYAALIGLVNWALGTNFLYLARKPTGPTPFDWFGPWPWYILSLELGFLIVLGLLELPLRALRGAPSTAPAPGTPRAGAEVTT
jgi:hypothetical integral membrane protein (TIGR02206 family)